MASRKNKVVPGLEQENSHMSLERELNGPESDQAAGASLETELCQAGRVRAITF